MKIALRSRSSLFLFATVVGFAAGCSSASTEPTASPREEGLSGNRDYHVSARGHFDCIDDGVSMPLAYARVEIMNSNVDGPSQIGDDVMATGWTNANGDFSIEADGGDGGSWYWSKPDVYARIVLTDDDSQAPVRVTDELNNERTTSTPQHDHDNVDGVVDLGSFWWGTQHDPSKRHNSSACAVFVYAHQAVNDYFKSTFSFPPAGHYDVEYWSAIWANYGGGTPWTNTDTTHWPREYTTDGGRVNHHEFAHSVRHSFDGDSNHFNWDVTRFRYARNHDQCNSNDYSTESGDTNRAFAFNEGWAEYWEGATGGCTMPRSTQLEGDVASLLAEYANCHASNVGVPGGKVGAYGMVNVLRQSPGQIHSLEDFDARLHAIYPDACGGVVRAPITTGTLSHAGEILAASTLQQATQQEIAAMASAIDATTGQLNVARAAAARVVTPCRGVDCYAAYQTLVKPSVLAGQIQTLNLAKARLQHLMASGGEVQSRIANGTFDAWWAADKKAYWKTIGDASVATIQQMMSGSARLATSPDAQLLLRDLRVRLASLKQKLATGAPPPSFMQPSMRYPNDVLHAGRGVTPPPPPPPPPPVQHTVTVTFVADPSCSPAPTGTIASTPAGLSCAMTSGSASACSHAFDATTAVTLAAAPASATKFMGFSGDCSGATCSLSMNADRHVTATFCQLIQ